MKKETGVGFFIFLLLSGLLLPLVFTSATIYSEATGATSLFLPAVFRPQPNYWIQNYWVNQNYTYPYFEEIEVTSSDDIILAGYMGESNLYGDGILAKISQNGDYLWLKRFNGTYRNRFSHMAIAHDGSYWAAGEIRFDSSYTYYPWLVRFDSVGNILWQKTYTPSPFSRAIITDVLATPDGGVLIAIKDYFHGTTIAKLNNEGTVSWAYTLNPAEDNTILEMKESPDGGIILVGNAYVSLPQPYDEVYKVWVVKMNTDGTVVWQRFYSQVQNVSRLTQIPFGVVTGDEGYTLGVYTNADDLVGNQTITLWVLHLSFNGNVIWQRNILNAGEQYSDIIATQDDGIVVAGAEPIQRPWVLKLTEDGSIAWQRLYNSYPNEWLASVSAVGETSVGDLFIVGRESYTPNHPGLMLIKLSSQGLLESCSCWGNNDMFTAEPLYYMDQVLDQEVATTLTLSTTTLPLTNVNLETERICPDTFGSICYVP